MYCTYDDALPYLFNTVVILLDNSRGSSEFFTGLGATAGDLYVGEVGSQRNCAIDARFVTVDIFETKPC